MTYIAHVFIGFGLSFIGSIPFGIINITVADTAINKGLKAGLWVGFGAAIVEFFQSFIAVKFADVFLSNPSIDWYFNVIATLIFFALAVYYLFFEKNKQPAVNATANAGQVHPFWKGILVSAVNVLVFPYWIFYSTYLSNQGWLDMDLAHVLVFCVGISLGGMLVFFLFAKMGVYMLEKGPKLMRYINLCIGAIFLAFGLFQLYKLVGT